MKQQMNKIYMQYYVETSQYFTDKSFFISSVGQIKTVQDSKQNFLNNCFIADGSHVKIAWLRAVVFTST